MQFCAHYVYEETKKRKEVVRYIEVIEAYIIDAVENGLFKTEVWMDLETSLEVSREVGQILIDNCFDVEFAYEDEGVKIIVEWMKNEQG